MATPNVSQATTPRSSVARGKEEAEPQSPESDISHDASLDHTSNDFADLEKANTVDDTQGGAERKAESRPSKWMFQGNSHCSVGTREFEGERGWNQFVGALPFLGLLIGIIIGGMANILNASFYTKRFHANGNKAVPEARLPPMMVGSVFFAAGLFLFGWTSGKDIPWIAPVLGTVLLGFGFFTIFQSALNYLIDTFQRYAASAIAANTFLRSVCALAFPLFVDPMYSKLGIPWATSVFGFFAVLLIPIPYLFYVYGPKIRARGKYSANMG
ncbi:hypothetical protein MMC17_002647 [Xylographa soralifera]|nr:hypothetical protein [Xylographa soralifera]